MVLNPKIANVIEVLAEGILSYSNKVIVLLFVRHASKIFKKPRSRANHTRSLLAIKTDQNINHIIYILNCSETSFKSL